jgi:fructose 5-dehydrogenase small subunit
MSAQNGDARREATRLPSRRTLLAGACASAAALAFTSALRNGCGLSGLPACLFGIAPADAKAPKGGGLDAFLFLSQHLTGRTAFEPVLSKRVYDALARSDSQFRQNVAALNIWVLSHGGVPSDTVTQALQPDEPDLAKTVSAIVRAWYLGLVGAMPHVQVVAYENALMFDPVKEILTVPSYCRDVPFYWSQKPVMP